MPLIDPTDLEQHLQIDFGDDNDPAIVAYIALAEALIEAAAPGLSLTPVTSDVETRSGTGNTQMYLNRWPVTAVNSINEGSDLLDPATDFIWKPNGQVIRTTQTVPPVVRTTWTRRVESIVIDYDYGVDPAGTIDELLRLAVLEIAGRMFAEKAAFGAGGKGALGVKSIKLEGSDSITYTNESSTVTTKTGTTGALVHSEQMILSAYVTKVRGMAAQLQ